MRSVHGHSARRELLGLVERLAAAPGADDPEAFAEILLRRRLFGVARSPLLAAYVRDLAAHPDRNAIRPGPIVDGPTALAARLHLLRRLAPGILTLEAAARGRTGPLPSVSILVVETGDVAARARCLASIRILTGYPRFDVSVVGGADGRLNEAAAAARGRLLLFLRSDAVVRGAAWLYDLVEEIEGHPRLGAVGATGAWDCFEETGEERWYADVSLPGLSTPVSWLPAGCLLVRREAFLVAGGFRTDLYGRDAWAEVHLGYALRAAGWISVTSASPIPVFAGSGAGPAAAMPEAFRRRFGGRFELVDAARGPETVRGLWDPVLLRWIDRAPAAAFAAA